MLRLSTAKFLFEMSFVRYLEMMSEQEQSDNIQWLKFKFDLDPRKPRSNLSVAVKYQRVKYITSLLWHFEFEILLYSTRIRLQFFIHTFITRIFIFPFRISTGYLE